MKYQKSMMKLMEKLLYSRNRDKSIEEVIREAHTGRNLSFKALNWLNSHGIVKIQQLGNQKITRLIIDNYTLQYKYYLDFIEFKTLDPLIKLIVKIFVGEMFKEPKIKSVVLFGSVLGKKDFRDIDLLLLGHRLDNKDIETFLKIREEIERIFGVILNIHISEMNLDNLFKGIVVYQSSYINFEEPLQKNYLEFLEWTLEAIKNQNDKKIFDISFNNAVVNISFIYCHLNSLTPKSKSEAVGFLKKRYKIANLNDLKKRGVEIGKSIFN